jgi:single-strand DNA-binding protein
MSNVFSFAGICGNDAEVRYLPTGTAILNVNVANTVGYGERRQTQWIRVALFGKPAEGTLKDYVKKGTHVFVSGELVMGGYTANDGTYKATLELRANVLDLVGGKRTDNDPYAQATNYPPASNKAPTPAPAASQSNFNDAPYDDDIPF